jgi:RHS repeat-associated protein
VPTREYIYSGSALLAKIESGATTYYHADQLSVRLMTDTSGNVIGQQGHYPFGEQWYAQNTATNWMFTTYERDSESGNDYAMARYNINRLGRFASPDLLAGSRSDPQSLNRYAYVRDDPVNAIDPTGARLNAVCGFADGCGGGAGIRMDEGCGGPFSLACDGGGSEFTVDGVPVGAQTAGWLLRTGAGVECPSDVCAGFQDGQYVQFTCEGDACGYLTQQQQYAAYECGGSFCSAQQHAQWQREQDAEWAYHLFMKALKRQHLDPNKPYTVKSWHKGLTQNIQISLAKLNVHLLPWLSIPDPLPNHDGPSYIGLSPVDTPHYVNGPDGLEYHEDAFGFYVPFHWLDTIGGLIGGAYDQHTFTCQAAEGCQ